jgi:hypothetical protein
MSGASVSEYTGMSQTRPLALANWNPNTDGLLVDLAEPPSSSKDAKSREAAATADKDNGEVIQHKDGGRVDTSSIPPDYSLR